MSSYPFKAKLFLALTCATGMASLLSLLWLKLPAAQARWWEIVIFIAAAAFGGSTHIEVTKRTATRESGSMSLGFALTFAALLRFGPAIGCVIGSVGMLSGCIYGRRQPLSQILFNVAVSATATLAAGTTLAALNGWTVQMQPVRTWLSAIVATAVYFALNTGAVATIVALVTSERPWPTWKQMFAWTAPTYFAASAISFAAIYVVGRQVAALLVFLSPVIFLIYRSFAVAMAREKEKADHLEAMRESQEHVSNLYLSTIESLALAIDAKDQYTHQHILRVQRYAVAVAEHMNLSESDREGVRTGALLHDIGKLGVPEYVLLKPGRLSDDEFEKIKRHPEIGAAILEPVGFPWPVLPVVKYHHEKWDGSGYPEGLVGEAIPLTARVLAVADVYDALTSNRSYRGAWPHARAVDHIKECAGKHFDPRVVDAFAATIDAVVEQMAAEGHGPLAEERTPATPLQRTGSEVATRHIQQTSTELFALYEVAQTLSSALGLGETLDILARKLEGIFPGTACVFFIAGEDSLAAHAAVGLNREFFTGSRTASSTGRTAQAAKSRMSWIGPYEPDDLMLTGTPLSQWDELRTALIVPIVHQDQVFGTINLYHPAANAFGPHDRRLIETIADRASLAIMNGLLFERTRSDALTDSLTGLYNVRYLTQYVEERFRLTAGRRDRMTRTSGTGPLMPNDVVLRDSDSFALLCLDLDSFKPINDIFGHAHGDRVLRDLANVLRNMVRDQDIVARYGGDEFIVLLCGAGPAEAENMANRLKEAVAAYDTGLRHDQIGPLHVEVSIGIACYPHDGMDWETLFSNADASMYRNKTDYKVRRMAASHALEQQQRVLPWAG